MAEQLSRGSSTITSNASVEERTLRFRQLEQNYWKAKPLNRMEWSKYGLAPGSRVADLGCGPATVLHDLHSEIAGLQLIGIDGAADYLELARTRAGEQNVPIEFVEGSASDLLPEQIGGRVDLLHIAHAIMVFGDLKQTVARLLPLIKPGGWLVIVETDLTSWKVAPYADGWDQNLAVMQCEFSRRFGQPLDPRLILPPLSAGGFGNIEFRAVSKAASLVEQPGFFHTYEVFFPSSEQDSAFEYLVRVVSEAPAVHRWGFKEHFVISAQAPS